MRLLKLTLHNFKGVQKFEFAPDGHSARIYGDNATGKTTIADALTWLLFDKDTQGRSPDSFGIKTRGEDGEPISGLEHSVEGVFDNITLRKIYKENWVTRRGSSETELAGHTTDYYVDDEPVKMKDYKERIEGIMSEEQFRMLTIPSYFAEQLHWKDRRDMLFKMVGDINTEHIIEEHPKVSRYPDVLDGKTEEARTKILKEQKRKLNSDLDNIPARIDEASGFIEKVEGLEEAREKVDGLKAKKETIEAKRSEVKAGGAVAELNVEKQELEGKKSELRNKHQQKIDEALSGSREKVNDLQDKVDQIESEFRDAQRDYESKQHALDSAREKVKKTEKQIQEVKEREPKPESDFGPEECPVCERPLEDGQEHDYQAYLKEFNAEKAADQKELKENLASFEEESEECLKELESAEQHAANIKGKLNQRKQALQKAQDELADQKANQTSVEDTDQWEALQQQIADVQQKIDDHHAEKQKQVEQLDSHIADLDQQIEEASKVIHQAETNEKYEKRIAELNDQRKQVREKLEQVEEDLYLIDEFVRARSEYVTDRINDRFSLVNWRLFKPQINGGLEECCDAIVDGVPYSEGLNTGSRIKAGLDIIETLSKHFGESAPVVIDNRESVTRLPETDLQVISLIVSPTHKKLTVEEGATQQLELAS